MTVQAWCPNCRTMVIPMPNGQCGWCDHQTGAADPPARPSIRAAEQLRKGDPGYGPECACGGPKHISARQCMECRRANGWRGGTPKGRHLSKNMTAEQADQARELYATGLSIRQVADVLFHHTTYKTPAALAQQLHSMFRRRGWPLRSQHDVTVARNWKHGRSTRAKAGEAGPDYNELRREQRTRAGIRQGKQCAGHKTQYPQKGRRCERPALLGSDYCSSHDPARAAAREQHLAEMRARREAVAA